MKRNISVWHIRLAVIYAVLFLFFFLLIFRSKEVMESVRAALSLCYHTMIPSLFPFFVLSGLLLELGFAKAAERVASPIMRPLFAVRGSGVAAFLIGILSGYPTGAKIVADLYKKRQISYVEGMRLLPFCNNSGPLFVIGAIGVGMLQSVRLGVFLFFVHVLSAILVGFCFRFYGKKMEKGKEEVSVLVKKTGSNFRRSKEAGAGLIFSQCVQSAVHNTLLICGFIVFFSAVSCLIRPFLTALSLPLVFERVIFGMLEISMGAKEVSSLCELPLVYLLSLLSFMIGFGGICVHLQVCGMLAGSGLSLKTYFAGKCLQAMISAILTVLCYCCLPNDAIRAWSHLSVFVDTGSRATVLPVCICSFSLIFLWWYMKKKIDF